ncbi:MAG TPA: hypothetical protein PL123_03140 [Bacteroidales bacterium]|nr:hypothetical protein [Bacteroidales bacterium]
MVITGAVITADIVNSKALSNEMLNRLTDRLKNLINTNNAKFLSFYRGDSFQCYCVDPWPAFNLALKLRCETNLFRETAGVETDLKISLGIGEINSPVTNISTAMGKAFIISGEELEKLDSRQRRFIIRSGNEEINIAFDAISFFTDYLFSDLTVKQAEVLQHLLKNRTQTEIANLLDKSQSTINRHVQALGWGEMEHLLDIYKRCIQKISHPNE